MVEIGAADVIDYKTDQFKAHTKQYDIIFDAVGKIKKGDVEKMLKSGGNFISVAGYGVASERKAFLNLLNQMYEEGQLKAVIDRTFALEDIVAAHTYVDLGVKTGNVAITINHD
jgi:NADPH:quinone reductase-like Zn-dependent oxidoreductase